MSVEQQPNSGDQEFQAGTNEYAQLAAERAAGLNSVEVEAKAEVMAHAAVPDMNDMKANERVAASFHEVGEPGGARRFERWAEQSERQADAVMEVAGRNYDNGQPDAPLDPAEIRAVMKEQLKERPQASLWHRVIDRLRNP